MKIMVATRNAGKLREIRAGLADLEVELLSLADFPEAPEVVEDGDTFEANAVKKAKTHAAGAGLPALADDSGLEVEALAGAPGIRSARFAGQGASDAENNQKLLALLQGVPPEKRGACFRCVIALAWPGGKVEIGEGMAEGQILETPRGDRGFGYDPLFYSAQLRATFGEVGPEEKLKVSHRGKALARIRAALQFSPARRTR